MDKKELTCICCPMGCRVEVIGTDSGLKVSGNQCKRGEVYAISELTAPTRVLTSTVKTNSKFLSRLPIRTDKPMPKELMFKAMDLLNNVLVEVPVKTGDKVIENMLGTDVNVIASRSLYN
jgi:CxxC motif-containing protein